MTKGLYLIGGLTSIFLGTYVLIKQIKTFAKGEEDELGFDIKLLFGGIAFIILGIGLLGF